MKQRNVKSYLPTEQSHPNYSVEASDTCVLTVFPPQWDDEMSDDDVVNYATGMFGHWSALLCMDDSHELLVLRDGRLETQHLFTVSSVKQEVQAEHEQSQLVQLS